MTKGPARPRETMVRVREETFGGGGGGSVEFARCTVRIVRMRSEFSVGELRAMVKGLIVTAGDRLVVRRRGRDVATVTSDIAVLRSCIDAGIRYEAALAKTRDDDGLRVPARPLVRR